MEVCGRPECKAKGKSQKAKVKRQKSKGKRQKQKRKRQKIKSLAFLPFTFAFRWRRLPHPLGLPRQILFRAQLQAGIHYLAIIEHAPVLEISARPAFKSRAGRQAAGTNASQNLNHRQDPGLQNRHRPLSAPRDTRTVNPFTAPEDHLGKGPGKSMVFNIFKKCLTMNLNQAHFHGGQRSRFGQAGGGNPHPAESWTKAARRRTSIRSSGSPISLAMAQARSPTRFWRAAV